MHRFIKQLSISDKSFSESASGQFILVSSKLSIIAFEHFPVLPICILEFFVVFWSSQPSVLLEVGDSIDLMALAGPELLQHNFGVFIKFLGSGSQDIEVHAGMVHQVWLLVKLHFVVKSIHLPRLSVRSVRFLLNFVGLLSEGHLVLSLSEGDVRCAFVRKLMAIHRLHILVDMSADRICPLPVLEVQVINFTTLQVILVEVVLHLVGLADGIDN